MLLRIAFLVALVAVASAVPLNRVRHNAMAHARANTCTVVTASSVANSGGKNTNPSAATSAAYLVPESCLGLGGPISAMGPLGILGPIGSAAWNPSAWFSMLGDWSHLQSKGITAAASSPLQVGGPMAAYGTMANGNDFVKQLQANGLFAVLGPLGPLGPVGALGPLGPLGIHGYARNAAGAYVSGNQIMRQHIYPWDPAAKTSRTWDLYEYYPNLKSARAVAGQDTSFMYESNIAVDMFYNQTPDLISFTSPLDQFVTIVCVPQRMADAWTITLMDGTSGKTIASSSETYYVNWIHVKAVKGQKFTVQTKLALTSVPSLTGFSYRLYVTGSTDLVTTGGVTGKHVLTASF